MGSVAVRPAGGAKRRKSQLGCLENKRQTATDFPNCREQAPFSRKIPIISEGKRKREGGGKSREYVRVTRKKGKIPAGTVILTVSLIRRELRCWR